MAKIFLANGINYYVIDEDNANDMTEWLKQIGRKDGYIKIQ
jgi:hypothetical protein